MPSLRVGPVSSCSYGHTVLPRGIVVVAIGGTVPTLYCCCWWAVASGFCCLHPHTPAPEEPANFSQHHNALDGVDANAAFPLQSIKAGPVCWVHFWSGGLSISGNCFGGTLILKV